MPESIDMRVAKLEVEHGHLKRELQELDVKTSKLTDTVQSISKTLDAIKNWIIGGVLVVLSMQVGLVEILKKLFL